MGLSFVRPAVEKVEWISDGIDPCVQFISTGNTSETAESQKQLHCGMGALFIITITMFVIATVRTKVCSFHYGQVT